MPGWRGSNGNITDNTRSVIDPNVHVSKDHCMVGIYSGKKSRTIIIETGDAATREIHIYTGNLDLIPSPEDQPIIWDWERISEGSLSDQARVVQELRSSAGPLAIEFQITAEEFTKFKASLEAPVEDNPVEGNIFDQSIRRAGNAIDRIIDIENDISLFPCTIL